MNHFLFGIYPYIVATVFLVGTIMRFKFDQYGWTAQSSELLEKRNFRTKINLFHIFIILLFLTHIFGLLTPPKLYEIFITHRTKQILAIFIGGFVAGIICFIAITLVIVRRLFSPRIRRTSKSIDLVMMLILYTALILGLITLPFSHKHLNGENLIQLSLWARHLVTFQADASSYMDDKHLIYKIHVFFGMTIFLIFPFTRLVHILSVPIGYLFRSYTQIVRSK